MISSSSISKSLLLSTLVCNISLLSSRLADHTIRLLSRLTNRTIVAFVDGVLQANISIYGWRDLNSSSRLRRQQRLRMPRPARWGRLGRCRREWRSEGAEGALRPADGWTLWRFLPSGRRAISQLYPVRCENDWLIRIWRRWLKVLIIKDTYVILAAKSA